MQPATTMVETVSEPLDGGSGGVAVHPDGRVFLADFGAVLSDRATMGRKIFVLDVSGGVEIFATGFEGASGNAFDAHGFLLQSNIRGNSVSRIAPDGTHSIFATEGIVAPVGITIDPDGALFVANCGDGSIRRVSADGTSHAFVESDLLKCPNGITIDDKRNLYVANFDNGDVIEITPDGDTRRLVTLPGENNGHLTYFDGFLYVVARGAHQIFRVDRAGNAVPFAGTGERGRQDGPAESATFSYPNDIAVDADGASFYVNEIASSTSDHTQLSPMVVRRIRFRDPR